eukprot:CAMPEP_0116138410 /NCGR_PEP_ID=MMETSP0329-20121206/12769_1 /TAXON_ID=697910 /ORGANISM="Pseudo-nitzschia arenysensis, Strain B593" /LENGTH=178 /DNA_ID=CAMNT_0003633395 /DNA_START=13 /DNA_END=549 /DNA_ORIENTATION=-
MIASSRILSIVAVLAMALATLPSMSFGFNIINLIPQDLLDKIPDACKEFDDSDFQDALNCAFDNLATCSAIIGKIQVFQDLPSVDEIETCGDIEAPFCEIATTCTVCMEEFDRVIRCIVRNDPLIGSDSFERFLSNSTDDMLAISNSTELDDIFAVSNSTEAVDIAELADTCVFTCDA